MRHTVRKRNKSGENLACAYHLPAPAGPRPCRGGSERSSRIPCCGCVHGTGRASIPRGKVPAPARRAACGTGNACRAGPGILSGPAVAVGASGSRIQQRVARKPSRLAPPGAVVRQAASRNWQLRPGRVADRTRASSQRRSFPHAGRRFGRRPAAQPAWELICAAMASLRRFSSSGGTSSTCVAIVQRWPNGSSSVPVRSP